LSTSQEWLSTDLAHRWRLLFAPGILMGMSSFPGQARQWFKRTARPTIGHSIQLIPRFLGARSRTPRVRRRCGALIPSLVPAAVLSPRRRSLVFASCGALAAGLVLGTIGAALAAASSAAQRNGTATFHPAHTPASKYDTEQAQTPRPDPPINPSVPYEQDPDQGRASQDGAAPSQTPDASVPQIPHIPRGRYRWPLDGVPRILRAFQPPPQRWAAGHRGVDLLGTDGLVVRAAGDGIVHFAGQVAGRFVISINHEDDLRTTYEPVIPSVRAGQVVQAGDPIGVLYTGNHQGCAGSTCLHWGLRQNGQYLDPLSLLGLGQLRLLPVDEPTQVRDGGGTRPQPPLPTSGSGPLSRRFAGARLSPLPASGNGQPMFSRALSGPTGRRVHAVRSLGAPHPETTTPDQRRRTSTETSRFDLRSRTVTLQKGCLFPNQAGSKKRR